MECAVKTPQSYMPLLTKRRELPPYSGPGTSDRPWMNGRELSGSDESRSLIFITSMVVARHDSALWPTVVPLFVQATQAGSVLRSGRPSVSETVELVGQSFQRSPTKSTRQASCELQIPQTSLLRILHKRLRLHAYKVQIVQDLQPNDCPRRAEFAIEILNRIDVENAYLNRICFSDESTFHVSGMVNRHNVRIWGSENPHVSAQLQRDSPKVNVWCGLMHNKLEEFQPWTMFQQDGAPPYWGSLVRDFLDKTFPDWKGWTAWPLRSPDITH
ncbi:hypothetical protein AVEN_67197-1 [Araneus ventricosus]|uniref:Tc1-like transposase DDE domain-containing protein n=1 Tax=Araneus ventricosus TaxID=182803 RepID=A0A4Y2SC21_ARAVE|nr:hypothetical protein AVEN_67197-1 [Araneus ventricosus]